MKCRAAQRLISAERDERLPASERAALEAHVAGCAPCRADRESLAAAAAAWATHDRAVAPPDVEQAWRDIRRGMRQAGPDSRPVHRPWWMRTLWTAVPALGAAAVALVVWIRGPKPVTDPEAAMASWAQFVEVNASVGAPVVIVDEASGWVVVWAAETDGGQS